MSTGRNPYLPLNEYVPDSEPHVFGDRVYVYGSHDKEDGETYCMLDYVCYSASVYDLTDWKYEGVIYKASRDPDYGLENSPYSPVVRTYLYAPDVVRGNDGRYYLYYCLSGYLGEGGYHGPISVAVCDEPAGEYEYLGYVRNADKTPLRKGVCFDPAVINDEGTIRLYYGASYPFEEEEGFASDEDLIQTEMKMFNKTRDEILEGYENISVMGAYTVELKDDMLTVKGDAHPIIPYKTRGTDFEAHPFYEGSSIRRIGNKYYFVYSSLQNHELCYATSDHPDRDYSFGGTIVSNGDIGINGRREDERLNMTGTTHGGIECINGKWYVFYHRLTHKSDYSRQGCAEPIEIGEDGRIKQVPITSQGLNIDPLPAKGEYPAVICCILTNGKMPHGSNKKYDEIFPHVGSDGKERFLNEVTDGSLIGYRYFNFQSLSGIWLVTDEIKDGIVEIYDNLPKEYCAEGDVPGELVGTISLKDDNKETTEKQGWYRYKSSIIHEKLRGISPLFFIYRGKEQLRILSVGFED